MPPLLPHSTTTSRLNEGFVTLVSRETLDLIWDQASDLLRPLVEAAGTHSLDDIRDFIARGDARLWVQFSDRVEVACVTELVHYPHRVVARVWLIAARPNTPTAIREFERLIGLWGKAYGATHIRVEGRRGWKWWFRKRDLTETTILEAPL